MRFLSARACVLALGCTIGCAEDGTTTGQDGGTTTDSTAATGGGPGSGGSGSGSGGSTGVPCADVITCDQAPPDVGLERPWEHTSSSFTAGSGFANHRGRDMFYNPGDTMWIMGKFAYGTFDDDIADEDVDIYLNRSCGSGWEFLATQRTTDDGEHATVEGVEDTGGWIYYQVPSSLALEPGRHRFLLVVGGDLSTADVYIDIVEPGTPVIVTDVDGTLTTSENAEFPALLSGSLPDANPDSAAVITALAEKGYRVFYLTARPEWLGGRTREFVEDRGFPLGIVHTTLTTTGATGAEAQQFKTAELAALAAKGMIPAWAFGNTDSDAGAFETAGVEPPEHRIMFQFTDATHGCRRIEAYGDLLPEIGALGPAVCP